MKGPLVTDHALLRFCERALDFDRAPIEHLIRSTVGTASKGLFKLPGYDLCAQVKDRTVVTIVPMAKPTAPKPKKPKVKTPVEDKVSLKGLDVRDWRNSEMIDYPP